MIFNLTNSQTDKIFKCHSRVGCLIVKNSDESISKIDFYTGKDKKIYALNDNIPATRLDLNQKATEGFDINAKW